MDTEPKPTSTTLIFMGVGLLIGTLIAIALLSFMAWAATQKPSATLTPTITSTATATLRPTPTREGTFEPVNLLAGAKS